MDPSVDRQYIVKRDRNGRLDRRFYRFLRKYPDYKTFPVLFLEYGFVPCFFIMFSTLKGAGSETGPPAESSLS